MFQKIPLLIIFILCLGLCITTGFAATYTWLPAGGSGDYQVAANWSPTRTTPATNDVLIFDGSQPGFSVCTATNVNAETISALTVYHQCTAYLQVAAAKTLTCGGSSANGAALYVGPNSQLIPSGGFALQITLPTGSKGTCDGDIAFLNTGASIAHHLVATDTDSMVFSNGATFQLAPTSTGGGNPFGLVGKGVITFLSGATYYQGGSKSTSSFGGGSSPMGTGGAGTDQPVTFNSGATFYNWTGTFTENGKWYGGNVIWNNIGSANLALGGATNWAINGNLTFKNTMTSKVANSGAGILTLGGNLIVESGSAGWGDANAHVTNVGGNLSIAGVFTPAGAINLNGSGAQTISITSALNSLTINNAAGITLLSNATVGGTLTLTSGNINTGSNSLVLGSSGNAGILNRTSGSVIGTMVRGIPNATGSVVFPLGTASYYNEASINFTVSPSSGWLAGSFIASDPGNNGEFPLNDNGTAIAAASPEGYWSFTPSGVTGGTYDIALQANGFNLGDPSYLQNVRVIKRPDGADSFNPDGTAGTNVGKTIIRTGIDNGTGLPQFGIGGGFGVPVELSNFMTE